MDIVMDSNGLRHERVKVVTAIIIEYAWTCLKKQGS